MCEECDLRDRGVCESAADKTTDRCEQCDLDDNRPRIVIEEKQARMLFNNPNRMNVHRIHVDGCAITEGPRCDWLLVTPNKTEHYVELKGSDVAHALEQIEESIKKLSRGARTEYKMAFVISGRNPLTSTEVQNRKKEFKKQYNAALRMERRNFEYAI